MLGVILLDGESKACGGIGVNIFNYKVILKDLRDTHLVPSSNWSSFYWPGLHHTMSQTNSLFFNQKVKGLTIVDWFGQTMDGTFKHLDPQ